MCTSVLDSGIDWSPLAAIMLVPEVPKTHKNVHLAEVAQSVKEYAGQNDLQRTAAWNLLKAVAGGDDCGWQLRLG